MTRGTRVARGAVTYVGSVVGTALQEPSAATGSATRAAGAAVGAAVRIGEGLAAGLAAAHLGGQRHLAPGHHEEAHDQGGGHQERPGRRLVEQDEDRPDDEEAAEDGEHPAPTGGRGGHRGRGRGRARDDDLGVVGGSRTSGHEDLADREGGARGGRGAGTATQRAHRAGEAVGGLGLLRLVVAAQPHGDEDEGPHADDDGVDESGSSDHVARLRGVVARTAHHRRHTHRVSRLISPRKVEPLAKRSENRSGSRRSGRDQRHDEVVDRSSCQRRSSPPGTSSTVRAKDRWSRQSPSMCR